MTHRRVRGFLVVAVAMLLAQPAFAQTTATAAKPAAKDSAAQRDGQHDFDWMFGKWKATLRRLVKPLSGSTTWVEFEGTQTTHKVMDGRANMDEFVVHNEKENIHVEGVTLRLYNAETKEWSIYWANVKAGVMAMPPTVGRFTDGRGEFYDDEEFQGRQIKVRYVWSNITATSAHFEQAFSTDGGKTWEVNWISDITRIE